MAAHHQAGRVVEAVRWAASHVPFCRERLSAAGTNMDDDVAAHGEALTAAMLREIGAIEGFELMGPREATALLPILSLAPRGSLHAETLGMRLSDSFKNMALSAYFYNSLHDIAAAGAALREVMNRFVG